MRVMRLKFSCQIHDFEEGEREEPGAHTSGQYCLHTILITVGTNFLVHGVPLALEESGPFHLDFLFFLVVSRNRLLGMSTGFV